MCEEKDRQVQTEQQAGGGGADGRGREPGGAVKGVTGPGPVQVPRCSSEVAGRCWGGGGGR